MCAGESKLRGQCASLIQCSASLRGFVEQAIARLVFTVIPISHDIVMARVKAGRVMSLVSNSDMEEAPQR